jgi:Putative prokaryotic signal transducing protein
MPQRPENIVLVTVATFPEAIEAHIFRNRLEAEGIPSVLGDEHIVSNQPWHSIAYGGVKLRVRRQDRERAADIIAGIRGEAHMTLARCPVCQSDKIEIKRNGNLWKGVLTLLFGIPGQEKKRTCLSCGHEWQIA